MPKITDEDSGKCWISIVGDPFNEGFRVYGPFDARDPAADFGEEISGDGNWWAAELRPVPMRSAHMRLVRATKSLVTALKCGEVAASLEPLEEVERALSAFGLAGEESSDAENH